VVGTAGQTATYPGTEVRQLQAAIIKASL